MQPTPAPPSKGQGRHVTLHVQNGYFCALGSNHREQMATQEYLRELQRHLAAIDIDDQLLTDTLDTEDHDNG